MDVEVVFLRAPLEHTHTHTHTPSYTSNIWGIHLCPDVSLWSMDTLWPSNMSGLEWNKAAGNDDLWDFRISSLVLWVKAWSFIVYELSECVCVCQLTIHRWSKILSECHLDTLQSSRHKPHHTWLSIHFLWVGYFLFLEICLCVCVEREQGFCWNWNGSLFCTSDSFSRCCLLPASIRKRMAISLRGPDKPESLLLDF